MKNVLFVTIFAISTMLVSANSTLSEAPADNGINWTTIDQAVATAKSSNKKFIMVQLYTDWCGWCKKMEENTFTDDNIMALISNNFIPVKFNAEIATPITFNGATYNFTKTGARGANQLAMDLGNVGGKLGYPTTVILDENGNKLQTFPGFKDIETLTTILKYFQSGNYSKMNFQQFQSGQ